jgi:hypothetical protein
MMLRKMHVNLYIGLTMSDLSPLNWGALSDKPQTFFKNQIYIFILN